MANLIVSTTNNNEPFNRAVQKVAADHIDGVPEITEGLLNHIEVAIRAYDPCLSCATHAMGKMPLKVSLFDYQGNEIANKTKE
jgi:NAD-reducing hydrogenase large subunit